MEGGTVIWMLALISSALYRIGGAGREEIPWANSQYRDIGCPVVVLIALLMHGHVWYLALAAALLVLGFIRTYWDCITGKDLMWMHGLGIGISMAPLYWSGITPCQLWLYSGILSVSFGLLNWAVNKFHVKYAVWIEELSRGFILVIAIQILNIK